MVYNQSPHHFTHLSPWDGRSKTRLVDVKARDCCSESSHFGNRLCSRRKEKAKQQEGRLRKGAGVKHAIHLCVMHGLGHFICATASSNRQNQRLMRRRAGSRRPAIRGRGGTQLRCMMMKCRGGDTTTTTSRGRHLRGQNLVKIHDIARGILGCLG
jgi:hypothetical protein